MKTHFVPGAALAILMIGLPASMLGCGGSGGGAAAQAPAAPTVAIGGTTTTAVSGPVTLTFSFSDPIDAFPASAVTVTNGTAAAATTLQDARHCSLVVTPTAASSGTMTIQVAAGAFTDAAGLANTAAVSASQPFDTIQPPAGWVLSWSDEFNGPDGSAPDPAHWTYDLGNGPGQDGWGNGELESYTSRPANVRILAGNLVITANQETFTGADGVTCAYTSARLKTLGLFAQEYGRFEARIKLPAGQGMWPAFWLLGSNFGATSGWPDCGEIDIMENIGREPAINHGSAHGPGYSGGAALSTALTLAEPLSADYHLYAIEWSSAGIEYYVDGTEYATYTPGMVTPDVWAFDHPFFILLNVAVGGGWPGAPDGTTVFPQTMQVDYVRVYTR